MTSTTAVKRQYLPLLVAMLSGALVAGYQPTGVAKETSDMVQMPSNLNTLTAQQRSLIPVAALAAAGDITRLNAALERALDAGVKVNELKETLIQVYAYAGFPRSLNALAELMTVTQARKSRGKQDEIGREPSTPIPVGSDLVQAGTQNQTKLLGQPVKAPIFEFAPAIDEYLKTHLFGDIFERDNVTWMDRELATLAMLSSISGVEAQLQSHVRIAMNVGLNEAQLRQFADILQKYVGEESAKRASDALDVVLDAGSNT